VVGNVSFDGEYRRGMILLNARLVGKERVAVGVWLCRMFLLERASGPNGTRVRMILDYLRDRG
jgi:hypothetical protein